MIFKRSVRILFLILALVLSFLFVVGNVGADHRPNHIDCRAAGNQQRPQCRNKSGGSLQIAIRPTDKAHSERGGVIIRSGPGDEYTIIGTLTRTEFIRNRFITSYNGEALTCGANEVENAKPWVSINAVADLEGWVNFCKVEIILNAHKKDQLPEGSPLCPVVLGSPESVVPAISDQPYVGPDAGLTTTAVIVRAEPDGCSTALGKLALGDQVKMVARRNYDWMQVSFGGVTGWVPMYTMQWDNRINSLPNQ